MNHSSLETLEDIYLSLPLRIREQRLARIWLWFKGDIDGARECTQQLKFLSALEHTLRASAPRRRQLVAKSSE